MHYFPIRIWKDDCFSILYLYIWYMTDNVSAQVFLRRSCEGEQQTGDEANYIV